MRPRWLSAALVLSTLGCDSFSSQPPDAAASADGSAAEAGSPAGDAGDAGDGGVPALGEPQLALGPRHSCALQRTGEVWCWGDGMLIGAPRGGSEFAPTRVVLPGEPEPRVVQLAAGTEHTCAITRAETLFCWGLNGSGQLSGAAPPSALKPFNVPLPAGALGFVAVAAGPKHTCAVARTTDSNNAVYCWGSNAGMEAGITTGGMPVLTPNRVGPLGGKVMGVAAGDFVSCAWTSAGAGYCWGNGGDGRRGDGTTAPEESASPKAIVAPGGASPLAGIDRIWVGGSTGCARALTGVSCWGTLGRQPDRNGAGFPLALTGGLVRHVALSQTQAAAGYLTDAGEPWYWGAPFAGAPANPSAVMPTKMALPMGLDATARVTAWAIADGHQCVAVRQNAPDLPSVFCAGRNEYSQLGNSVAEPVGSPTFVPVFDLFDR